MMQPTNQCDILIVGGGIHGVGVAQAAAAAGYETVLVEARELAAGTSSKSSKLIHGGLRYLEHGHIGLVRESLRERELLIRLAPGLVKSQAFFLAGLLRNLSAGVAVAGWPDAVRRARRVNKTCRVPLGAEGGMVQARWPQSGGAAASVSILGRSNRTMPP